MSLNGLEDVKVAEAYSAAIAEPGGWFLLKYASRDEVELLSTGSGGEAELRTAVAGYEEPSPLYGFLKYRRRNVIIKYLPEGCSRLIQARVAVHFNAVCERFSPFDTQFEMTVADDLKDSKLSAACSLHAASGSNSSSNSPRRKHLMEIAEEDEEEQSPTKRQSLIKDGNDQDSDLQGPKGAAEPTEPVKLDSELAILPENSKFSALSTSEVPNFVGAEEVLAAGRLSSQSSRDIYTSYSSFSTYSKPKVKIGPRPSLDTNPRPQTAGNFRPVSSIPAGFKIFGKGSNKKSTTPSLPRKDSVGSIGSPGSEISEITFATTIPIPEESGDKENLGVPRPATSSGVSTKSNTTMNSKYAMTPEKARLKKAMQLREKKRKMAAKDPVVTTVPSSQAQTDDDVPNDEEAGTDVSARTPVVQADSGIAIDTSAKDDQASELTVSDSRPTSPVVASSEAAQSTKASSISESTEQTVRGEDEEGAKAGNTDRIDETAHTDPTPLNGEEVTVSEKKDLKAAAGEQTLDAEISVNPSPLPTDSNATEIPVATGATIDDKAPVVEMEAELATPNIVHLPPAENSDITADIPAPTNSYTEKQSKEGDGETSEIPVRPLAADTESSTEDKDSQTMQVPTPSSAPQEPVDVPTSSDEVDSKLLSQQPADDTAARADGPVDGQDSDTDTIPARPSTEPSTRRKLLKVDPIRVDLANRSRPPSQSDINFSDSESLLEELHSATVEEAKPITVSKTPVTPVFPGNPLLMSTSPGGQNSTAGAKPVMVRTVSNPVRGNLARLPSDVSQSSARSVSQGGAAYLHKITQQRTGDNGLGKKNNVGSSISQRIKALELLSVNSGEAASQPGSRPSSAFFSVKKDRVPSRSPSVADRTNSLSQDMRPTTAQSSRASPEHSLIRPTRERSGSISSRLSMFEPTDSPGNQPRGRPETISVTARIIRDSPSTSRNATDRSPLELKQPLLSVDHHPADGTDVSVKELVSQGRQIGHSREPSKDSVNRRSSFTIVKDFIKEGRKSISSPSTDNLVAPGIASGNRSPAYPPQAQNNNSFTRRLSIGSRRSLSRDRGSISPSAITEGSGSGDETKSNSDKKKSRTSRLMRRLSSLSGTNRNKGSSPVVGTPTVTEEEWPEPKAPVAQEGTSVAVDLGDVNVQFPDTLLWKRRNMYLDTQGFVTLSAAAQQPAAKTTGVKRYHLSEFKTPYCPDVEVQELPNSVVLDFLEGSAVQVACEDRTGQMRVLNVLQEAYVVHGAKFGQ